MGSTGSFLFAVQCLVIIISVVAAAVCVVFRRRFRHGRRYDAHKDLFENEHGRATAESEAKFWESWSSSWLIAADICGVLLAILGIMVGYGKDEEGIEGRWMGLGVWIFLLLQTLATITVNRNPISRFNSGIILSVSYILVTAISIIQAYSLPINTIPHIILLSQTLLSAICFILCLTIPRHPTLYHDSLPTDAQHSTSFLSRVTYSWCLPLLRLSSSTQTRIELDDLPSMDRGTRAQALYDDFKNQKENEGKKRGLARRLVSSHTPALIRIYAMTVLSSALDFAPQLAMFQLLRALENRGNGNGSGGNAMTWAFGLGGIMFLKAVVDNWMWFLSHNHLSTPIRVQLSAMVLAKAMRRKDVQVLRSPRSGNEQGIEKDGKQDEHEEGDGGEGQGTRQGTINLVAVDSKRISEFCIYQNQFLGVFGKIVVSGVFLLGLIGWEALLAGLFVQLLTIPANVHFSKKYTNAQGELMKIRDTRLSIINEVLLGIRQIKFSALEDHWYTRIMSVRSKELSTQYSAFFAETLMVFLWLAGPVLLSAVSIIVYVLVHGSLSASVAFTTISILGTLQGTLAWIPELTTSAIQAWTSLKRIEGFLEADEKVDVVVCGDEIAFLDATVSWPSDASCESEEECLDDSFRLEDININFPNGELSIVCGPTGSGKSLLLSAILGEADLHSGRITVPTSSSDEGAFTLDAPFSPWIIPSAKIFVSQRPWVENISFRSNILFNLPFNPTRYASVLSACALHPDLATMPDGDLTEIGANGINLSGGQLWRLTLARALYSRAGILVMDDIFGAVDAHVGRHLLEHAVCGELGSGRTRILVTHHEGLFVGYDHFSVRLERGRVVYAGMVEGEGLSRGGEGSGDDLSTNSMSPTATLSENEKPSKSTRLKSHSIHSRENVAIAPTIASAPRVFVEKETRIIGNVGASVYTSYLNVSGGIPYLIKIALAFGVYEAATIYSSWWISLWVESYDTLHLIVQSIHHYQFVHQVPSSTSTEQILDTHLHYYVGVYLAISAVTVALGALRYLLVFRGSIAASHKLFGDFTYALLHAPMRWLDTVPLGRILNRFTSDFVVIDSEMGPSIASTFNYSLRIVGIVVAGTIVSPYILLVALLFLALSASCALYYLPGAREMKRMESISRSPVYETLGVLLAGVTTIRASGLVEAYTQNMFAMLDVHCRTLWYMLCFNTWLTVRLGMIGAGFTSTMALLLILRDDITASVAGFVLIFTLDYSNAVMWVLRQYTDIELAMNAIERVMEYSAIEIENQEGSTTVSAAWPSEGTLQVRDLVVGYAPDLPATLNGLSFNVLSNKRVGVVGRTGAGKSSLALAIFRVLEARHGSICIDGLDISKLRLQDLRSRLAIIPQNPVLFSGTIRSNIDPFGGHFDEEILQALHRVHFVDSMRDETSETATSNVKTASPLDAPVSEGGYNLSQGQRQLLCLARAIISRPKILVLDEATSAVDKATDELIQRSIREEFVNCTLIVIAHRLSTVTDFDKILVMGDGRRLEFGSPQELVKANGVFAEMLSQSGETMQAEMCA